MKTYSYRVCVSAAVCLRVIGGTGTTSWKPLDCTRTFFFC